MTAQEMDDVIRQALAGGKMLWLVVKLGQEGYINDRLGFDPYLYGIDVMGHDFLWGYMPQSSIYYKFRVTDILKAEVSSESVEITPDRLPIEYYYHEDEEIMGALGFLYQVGKGPMHFYDNKKQCDGE